MTDMIAFTEIEKDELLKYARFCLEQELGVVSNDFILGPEFMSKYSDRLGVFISLYKKNDLRGCIGQMSSDEALFKTIKHCTIASASRDYRFKSIKKKELSKVKIEISVLSKMKKIEDVSEIELGKHGIYIIKGRLTGTFLPQVAEKHNWSIEEFLGHCSETKVKIGWNGWKTADVYIYETQVFSED